MKKKFAMGIEYSGINYHGWQKQTSYSSIQYYIEKSLLKITNEKIIVFCGGRTDAGVHAVEQIVHFNTNIIRSETNWLYGLNANLPKDIVILWVKEISDSFHARHSAISRYYRYIIYNQKVRPAILERNVYHCSIYLNENNMNNAAKLLIGEHDFTSFKAKSCQSTTSIRNVSYVKVYKKHHYIIFDIIANSFLYHMVRNIVGSLLEIGKQKKSESWIEYLLSIKNRDEAGVTVSANGLYLVKIFYPKEFHIPHNINKNFLFLI